MDIRTWDERFLDLAVHISRWSKDPSTQVGSVIVRPDKTIASVGYNGFPRGIEDDERLFDRPVKYGLVIHAEMNAILNAKEALNGYTLYEWPPTTHAPTCERCAAHVIQAGITRVVGYKTTENIKNIWSEASEKAYAMYVEAGVEVTML
jgi:dCMP deaminase